MTFRVRLFVARVSFIMILTLCIIFSSRDYSYGNASIGENKIKRSYKFIDSIYIKEYEFYLIKNHPNLKASDEKKASDFRKNWLQHAGVLSIAKDFVENKHFFIGLEFKIVINYLGVPNISDQEYALEKNIYSNNKNYYYGSTLKFFINNKNLITDMVIINR